MFGAVLWRVMRWPPGNIGQYVGTAMMVSGAAVAAQPLVRVVGVSRALIAMLGAAAVGGLSEVVALYWPFFGRYEYLSEWRPVFALPGGHIYPAFLPLMWGTILTASYSFARQHVGAPLAPVVAALIAACADLVSEAVLTGPVGFWVWLDPTPLFGAPVANFVSWLLVSLVGSAWIALVLRGERPSGVEPTWIIGAAMLGTAIIGGTHGEPRGLLALLVLAVVLAWRTKASDTGDHRVVPPEL